MNTELLELLPDLVEVVFFGLSTVGLSIASVYIEWFAFATVQGGEPMLGVWAGVMGAVALSFAYLIGTDKFVTKLMEFKRATIEPSERSRP